LLRPNWNRPSGVSPPSGHSRWCYPHTHAEGSGHRHATAGHSACSRTLPNRYRDPMRTAPLPSDHRSSPTRALSAHYSRTASPNVSRPRPERVQPMVSLRQNMAQPEDGDPTQAKPLPVPVHTKLLIHQTLQIHARHVGDEHRNVIHSFTGHYKCFFHPGSLSQSQSCVQK